ncbi:hypothetical protein Tco_1274379 [Tanacetum coccineum]
MDTTRAQQKALDDDLVASANRLQIGKCNLWLSPTLKSKEPTIQVVLDALKLTSFYKAFEITADVPEIYIFALNSQVRNLKILYLKRKFYLLLETLDTLCLSGKTTALESLRLSCAQILWSMYHNKNVDYVYLLWEDLVYQVENKNSKKNNDIYYPRFTKVIVDYFMAKDLSIPRRNKMFWHTSRDDPVFTTIRVVSKHQDTQIYGAILPQHLTNQAMLESEAYKTYHAYATGEKIPKTKYAKNKADPESSPKKKSAQASKGKRIKTSTKVAKPVKKKQPATMSKEKGLNVLSKVAFADEGTSVTPGVPDVSTYNSDDEQISWKSSDEDDDDEVNNDDNEGDDDQDDDNEQTESDNDDDDLVHPKLSTFDEKERQDEEDKEEEWYDDEAYDGETQGVNTNIQSTQVTEDTHVIITAATLEDVPVSTNVKMPPSVTPLPPPPIPFIQPQQQTPIPTPTIVLNRLRDEAQAENENFINTLDENMRKIIKKQVKEQVKEQVSKILPKIKKFVNDQLEAEVLTRSSNQAKTSHAQKTLYKALADAYEADKDILETYGDTVTFKRRQDDKDKDKEPSAGSNRESK